MIRYYPKNKIKTGLSTKGDEFLLNGAPYVGKYYSTYDGKFFSGTDPVYGENIPLAFVRDIQSRGKEVNIKNPEQVSLDASVLTEYSKLIIKNQKVKPVSYFPSPTEEDYKRGYMFRYFTKRINDNGYIIEISGDEYASIKNGTANYDVSLYHAIKLFWKLTGYLNTVRISQYDTRSGIIDTNKRLVEKENKTFLGIKDFIAEEYSKFTRPNK